MMLEGNSTQPVHEAQSTVEVQNHTEFPSLQASASHPWSSTVKNGTPDQDGSSTSLTPPLSNLATQSFTGSDASRHTFTRPTSRQQYRSSTPFLPGADDDAFPTLGSATAPKGTKKLNNKWNELNQGQREVTQSLADIVRKSPSPSPIQLRKVVKSNKVESKSRENSEAAEAIPPPEHVPWLEIGNDVNNAYLKARQEAFKHGGLRNKFLQRYATEPFFFLSPLKLIRIIVVRHRHGIATILAQLKR